MRTSGATGVVLIVLATVLPRGAVGGALAQDKGGKGAKVADSADAIVDRLATVWSLKAASQAEGGNFGQDDLIALAIAGQDAAPERKLAWYVARSRLTPDEAADLAGLRLRLTRDQSDSVLNARIGLESETLLANTRESEAARARVNAGLARLAVEWSKGGEGPLPAELAKEMVRVETLWNNLMTPDRAKKIIEAEAATARGWTKGLQQTMNKAEMLVHKGLTPERARWVVKATATLEGSATAELRDSRKQLRERLRKVLDDNPKLLADLRRGLGVVAEAESRELKQAREQAVSRIKAASK